MKVYCHFVRIREIQNITHNCLHIVVDKPYYFTFIPGQAIEISINKLGWLNNKRPFTCICLPSEDYLEFIIKSYPSHKGVTNEMKFLKRNDELILHSVFGSIRYKGEGVFIAGGTGITPFISIFRNLNVTKKIGDNKLIYANNTKEDILLEEEFTSLLGDNFIPILSDENKHGYEHGLINTEFIKSNVADLNCYFYICGPQSMMKSIQSDLNDLGIKPEKIVTEIF
jgi:ferredoxin-NADP reductase